MKLSPILSLGIGALLLAGVSAMAQNPQPPVGQNESASLNTPAARLGWQLAVHSYTFKNFTLDQCIEKTVSLGVKYMSLSGHVNLGGPKPANTEDLTDAEIQMIQDKVAAVGIQLVNIGVMTLPPDEAKSRKVFEVAKKLGVDVIVAEPVPEAFDTIEKLCKEYNIKVAIHEHPKPNRYWHPDNVLAAIKGRSPLIGACADTGHWVRSGLDPVECLKKLDGHILAVHFKDLSEVSPKAHDVPWGTGASNIRGQLAELARQGFHGAFCVEYEYHWDNSVPEIAECVKAFNQFAGELDSAQAKR